LTGSACQALPATELPLELAIRNSFVQLLTPQKNPDVTGTTTYQNDTFRRFSFTAVSGVILHSYHAGDRVKVSSGKLAKDPVACNLTMGAVNIHPFQYDGNAEHMTVAERFRFFAGGVVVPNFGVGGGLSMGIIRGLSFNAGYAELFVSKLGKGEVLDAAPKSTNPFSIGMAGAVFFGGGFTFK